MPPVEVQLEPIAKKIKFVKLPPINEVYYVGTQKSNTYVCEMCKAVCVSKVDHTRYHQNMLDMIVAAEHDKTALEELKITQYQPSEGS